MLRRTLAQAEIDAQRTKLLKRIERLKAGGHDTSGLERTYKDLLTPRQQKQEVPGIPVGWADRDEGPMTIQHQATRILTPTERKNFRPEVQIESERDSGRESCAVQTEDFVFASGKRLQDILREQSKVEIEYKEGKVGQKASNQRSKPPANQQSNKPIKWQQKIKEERPPRAKPGEKKPWQYQNIGNKRAVKASDREVALGSAEKREREMRRKERASQMIAMADANMAKSRLLVEQNHQHGRLVPVIEQQQQQQRPRSRSQQRQQNQPNENMRRQRHFSPPADLPTARNMPPPPQQQIGQPEFLPFRRSSGGLERGELPPNYDMTVEPIHGGEKGQIMRQHLQMLRQGLLQRQQELERSMSPNTLHEIRASQQYRQT